MKESKKQDENIMSASATQGGHKNTKMADGRCPDKSLVDILKATQQGTEPVYAGDVHWGTY